MKSGDVFKLEQKWWSKNKPTTLKSTGLGEVLGRFEVAAEDCKKQAVKGSYVDPKKNLFLDAEIVLDDVEKTVAKAKSMCNKTLHKECIEVLDTAKNSIKAQRVLMLTYKEECERRYKKIHDEMVETAKNSLSNCQLAKKKGEQLFKEAKESNGSITGTYQIYEKETHSKSFTPDKAEVLVPEMLNDLEKLKKIFVELEVLYKEAETLHSAVKDGGGVLGIDHRDDQIKVRNLCGELKNDIGSFRDDTKLFIVNSATHAKEIKKALDNAKVEEKSYLKRLTQLRDAMFEVHESARKLSNTLIPWGDEMRFIRQEIAKAEREGRPWQQIDKVTIPVDRWKGRADEYRTKAVEVFDKTKKMSVQASQITKKTLEAIPDEYLKKSDFETLKKEVQSKVDGVAGYVTKNEVAKNALIKDCDFIFDAQRD